MKNKIIKDALALTLITLVAGVALGGVYEITKDPIAKQEAQAKAEAYASKNGPVSSLFDGIGMGLGFTVGLTSIGIVRELIGSGKIFGMTVFNGGATIFILAPGAFFVLAMLVALQNRVKMKKDPAAAPKACDESLCAGCTNHMCASKKNAEKGGTQS